LTVLPSWSRSSIEAAGLLLQWDRVWMLKMERCLMMIQVKLDRSFLHKLRSAKECTHEHPQRTFLRTDTQVQLILWDRTDPLIMLWVRRCTPKDLLQASNQIGSTAEHPLPIHSTEGHPREQSLGKSWTSVQCTGMEWRRLGILSDATLIAATTTAGMAMLLPVTPMKSRDSLAYMRVLPLKSLKLSSEG